jgi:hypothetical protein
VVGTQKNDRHWLSLTLSGAIEAETAMPDGWCGQIRAWRKGFVN